MGSDDRTYIKVFRKLLRWGWYGDTNTFRVFMHILLTANYTPKEYKGEMIGAGECIFGRKAWSEKLGLSEQQIRTAINHLKSTNEITTKSTNKFTIIHVEKWEFWQFFEGDPTNEPTNDYANEQPTSNQQLTTPKESKNIRNKETVVVRAREDGEESFTNIWGTLSSYEVDKICAIYTDGIELIDAVHDEVALKHKTIEAPYRYVVGYAQRTGWPKINEPYPIGERTRI